MLTYFLKEYKTFLYNQLLQEENCNKSCISFAKIISASVPAYLGRQADLDNESEKEIYFYARQLMTDLLNKKTDYQRLFIQIQSEIKIDRPVIKDKIEVVYPTPLMEAILTGNYREFRRLIKDGADVNETNGDGKFTPLSLALRSRRNPAIYVEGLLDAGADIQQFDKTGCELLMSAQDNLDLQVIKLLQKAGVNINASDESHGGYTALMRMSMFGYIHSAKALIDAGADVNGANQYGQTPLYWAISNVDYPMTKMMLEAGADVDRKIDALGVTHRKLMLIRFKEDKESRKKLIALMREIVKKQNSQQKTNNNFIGFLRNIFSGRRR